MSPIIGIWRLVATTAHDDSGTMLDPPMGPLPLGIVTLTAEGRMLAVLSDGRPELPPGTRREYRSYIGAYTFDGTTLVTKVDGADDPSWLDSEQVRAARFENGRMILRPPPRMVAGRLVHRELAWERLVAEQPQIIPKETP